jgi:hypothetical protein
MMVSALFDTIESMITVRSLLVFIAFSQAAPYLLTFIKFVSQITFQRCMELLLGDLHWTGVLVTSPLRTKRIIKGVPQQAITPKKKQKKPNPNISAKKDINTKH